MRILSLKSKVVRSFCNMTIKGILIGTLIAIVVWLLEYWWQKFLADRENKKKNMNMKYTVGDKVRIKGIGWYNWNKDEHDDIECSNNIWFYREMSKFCGKVMTISHVRADHYTMVEDLVGYWTDEMIECKVGRVEEESNIDLTVKGEETKERIEITIPEGYEYVIESGKIIFTKKKKEYPKTYEECCRVLGISDGEFMFNGLSDDEYDLFDKFVVLKRCRDAYWKIAGEEMGLNGPWEPTMETVYCISRNNNVMKCSYRGGKSNILEFPTPEMRDAFKDNFGPDIEFCKEFL